MDIKCDICEEYLFQPGALLFSPPEGKMTEKYHVCLKCYADLIEKFIDLKTKKQNEKEIWETFWKRE